MGSKRPLRNKNKNNFKDPQFSAGRPRSLSVARSPSPYQNYLPYKSGATTVLSLTKIGFGGRSSMPKVSYPTSLDYFVILCFTFVFGAIVEYTIMHFLERATNRRRKAMEDHQKEVQERAQAPQTEGEQRVGALQFTSVSPLPVTASSWCAVFSRNARCDYCAVHDNSWLRRSVGLACRLLCHGSGLLRHTLLCFRLCGRAGVCLHQLHRASSQQAAKEARRPETPNHRTYYGVCILDAMVARCQ